MVDGCLAGVVRDGALLRNKRICTRNEDDIATCPLTQQRLGSFIRGDKRTVDVDIKCLTEQSIGKVTGFIWGEEHRCDDHDCVQTTIAEGGGGVELLYGFTIGDIDGDTDCGIFSKLAPEDLCRFFSKICLDIGADDDRAFRQHTAGNRAADTGTSPDHNHNTPRHFLLGWHPLQLRLFQRPILNIEGFFRWQRNVVVAYHLGINIGCGRREVSKACCTIHHVDSIGVELTGHASFRGIFAKAQQPDSGDKNHTRIRATHRRALGLTIGFVVSTVVIRIRWKRSLCSRD